MLSHNVCITYLPSCLSTVTSKRWIILASEHHWSTSLDFHGKDGTIGNSVSCTWLVSNTWNPIHVDWRNMCGGRCEELRRRKYGSRSQYSNSIPNEAYTLDMALSATPIVDRGGRLLSWMVSKQPIRCQVVAGTVPEQTWWLPNPGRSSWSV